MKTLAHEAGHVLLHDPTNPSTTNRTVSTADATTARCRGVKEVEAESVAYLVTAAHGLDTSGYTFAYVTGWARTVLAVTAPEHTTGAADSR